MKTSYIYDHYYAYEEMKDMLEGLAKKYSELMDLEVNCISEEKRNQYVAILTNKKTGNALDKPGWYLDGNIHAGEVTSSMAALHTLDYLLTNYGEEETVTRILDTMTIYIIPRVSVDGAETYLQTPYSLRSVNRDYIVEEGGVKEEDIDGDGVIRMMRFVTPYGAWKKDSNDKSVMTLREPSDVEGEFYDIYCEGVIEEMDGENLKRKKSSWGLDFNRNFPYGWKMEGKQSGAGIYPLSNVETKAIVDFVLAHPNIGGAAIGHTSGGLLLYPPGTKASTSAPSFDMKILKAIAKMGEEEMGYEPLNIFDSFLSNQEEVDSGALDDWMYETQGIPCYTVEFWDLPKKAGKPIDWHKKDTHPLESIERFNACMKWVKENAPEYYSEWKEFDHPTLGKVEIGGFNYKHTWQNPPETYLLEEIEHSTKFYLRFMQAMPRLVIEDIEVKEITGNTFLVNVIVGNRGYLPTNLTDTAKKIKVAKEVEVTLENANVIQGNSTIKIKDLAGYSQTITGAYFYGNYATVQNAEAKKKVTWLIQGKKGDTLNICLKQEKAGKVEKEINL